MKRLLMTIAVIFCPMAANAQVPSYWEFQQQQDRQQQPQRQQEQQQEALMEQQRQTQIMQQQLDLQKQQQIGQQTWSTGLGR